MQQVGKRAPCRREAAEEAPTQSLTCQPFKFLHYVYSPTYLLNIFLVPELSERLFHVFRCGYYYFFRYKVHKSTLDLYVYWVSVK